MTLLATAVVSLWATVYTGSLTLALWRRGNRRGSIGTGLLAAAVLVTPPLVQWYVQLR